MTKRIIALMNGNKIAIYFVSDEYVQYCSRQAYNQGNGDLLNYLNASFYAAILLDTTKSIFENVQITSYETLLTDGKWLWSGDLAYYTEKHNFRWPPVFLESIDTARPVNGNLPDEEIRKIELVFVGINKQVFQEELNGPESGREIPHYDFEIIELMPGK